MNTNTFEYETIRESEKAVYVKVPYYEATSEYKKAHKQLFFECWIPKTIIAKGIAKDFVIGKRNEKRLSNSYQRLCEMPNSWKTLGIYAPIKTKYFIEVIDEDKYKELIKFYENKYGAELSRLVIDGEGKNGFVSDEDEKIINGLGFPNLEKPYIPKKQEVRYK